MRLALFAATGGTGRHVLEQAVAAGHEVTAVARKPTNLTGAARVVTADLAVPDSAVLESAVRGADAVVFCLGPRRTAEAGIASRGTQAIVEAMKETDTRRLVVISSESMTTIPSPGRPNPPRHDPGEGFLLRYVIGPRSRSSHRAAGLQHHDGVGAGCGDRGDERVPVALPA
jgi:nucleoside-diphosphate-sugar epimerase